VAALGMIVGNTAVNVVVLCSAVVPVIVVIVICFVFFRAARRNDEREALEKQAGPGPTGP
jgi:heme/copper-type cytochrome/quinol oxidase subunit 2